jgi:hypothetical protein
MIYKQQIQGLLESLEGKLRLIENVATGAMKLSNDEVIALIEQTKKIRERMSDLIAIERD